jgi:hypothetical protein
LAALGAAALDADIVNVITMTGKPRKTLFPWWLVADATFSQPTLDIDRGKQHHVSRNRDGLICLILQLRR